MNQPAARSDVLLRPMGAEWVLYDPDSRRIHVLNLSAALTWSALDGERTLEAVAEEICTEMAEVPDQERVLDDVRAAVERFREEGLLA